MSPMGNVVGRPVASPQMGVPMPQGIPPAPPLQAPLNAGPGPVMQRQPQAPFIPPTAPPNPGGRGQQTSAVPATMAPDTPVPPEVAAAAARAQASTVQCPRCGNATPLGFAYCQQCGLHLQPVQPTDPGGGPTLPQRNRPASGAQPVIRGGSGAVGPSGPVYSRPGSQQSGIDPQAATIAQDGGGARPGNQLSAQPATIPAANVPVPIANRGSGPVGSVAANAARAATAPAPAWGNAVLVNRDGSDGQRFPLAGEYLVVGRAGADIVFDEDRFLSRQHARFERANDGAVRINPLDTLNGVFRKADTPVELVDGMTILIGREVLRYERVDSEEMKIHPLVRHGVALFGSPPREPWGRLMQLVPSGGYRDIRHLFGEEVVLGREEGDIVFRDDAFMSRRHAAVTWNGMRAQLTDLGSSNGTFVRLTGPTALKHGDHVRMGDQLLRIELAR